MFARRLLNIGICFACAFVLFSCGTASLKVNNYSYLYKKDLVLHPDFRVFHSSADTSVLYFKLNTANLLYTRTGKANDFSARVKVEVGVFGEESDKVPIFRDSSIYIDTDNNQLSKDLIGKIVLPVPAGRNYLAKVLMNDLNRNTSDFRFVRVQKNNEIIERQGFLPVNADNNVPVVSKVLGNEKRIRFQYSLSKVSNVRVLFFPPVITIAAPPFIIDPIPAESLIPSGNYVLWDSLGYFNLDLGPDQGIYFIQSDSTSPIGGSLFRFAESHPKVGYGDQMIGPLRYITSNEEYNVLMTAPNKKIAAENFWIERCGSKERAREVIRAFYSRVEEANEFFSTYKEGWKTDRGMIYIIFGPPDGLYMRDGGESWVYGQETNVMSINLGFSKIDNPFSDNDLGLQRSGVYRSNWYTAVDFWRSGRIFSL